MVLSAPQLLLISPPFCGEHQHRAPRAGGRPLHPPPRTVPLTSPTSAGLYFSSDGQVWRWLPPIPTCLGPQAIRGSCATRAKALCPLGDSTSTTQQPSCLPGAPVLPPDPVAVLAPTSFSGSHRFPEGPRGFPAAPIRDPHRPWGPRGPLGTSRALLSWLPWLLPAAVRHRCPVPRHVHSPGGGSQPFARCAALRMPVPFHKAPVARPEHQGCHVPGRPEGCAWGRTMGTAEGAGRAELGSPRRAGCSLAGGPTWGCHTSAHGSDAWRAPP